MVTRRVTIPSHGWFMTWFYHVLPTENPGTGDFHRRNLHSLRSCLPADKHWCKHDRHLGGPNRTNGETDVLKHGILRVFYTKKIWPKISWVSNFRNYGFFFFFQIFGELHKSFSTFCRFNPNSIGKCILQLPITQNLDMCRHNISFLMTNPNW